MCGPAHHGGICFLFPLFWENFKKTKAKDTHKENQYLLDHFQITDNLHVSKFVVHTFLRCVSGGMYVPIRIISPTSLIKSSHVYDVHNFQNFVQWNLLYYQLFKRGGTFKHNIILFKVRLFKEDTESYKKGYHHPFLPL